MPTPYSATVFADAKDRYATYHVDVEKALVAAARIEVSMHCWQADDVSGFETKFGGLSGGGILATGHFPGRARNGDDARADYERVLSLVPGAHRLNLHACYAETGDRLVDRDALEAGHFARWMAWAAEQCLPLDFNPTCFAHPWAQDGFTLSHPDPAIRSFWIHHLIACRRIAMAFANAQGTPCVLNHWIPDGYKDLPADRLGFRSRLIESLDLALVRAPGVDRTLCLDFVESKLFGLGSEAFVVGSSEFYSSYALSRGVGLCMDMGHYHPTEGIHDKISAFLPFHNELLLHVSRPLRWDSDHVVLFNDDLRSVFLEIARCRAWDRVRLATDYFDASLNRIAAYVIGLRATRKAILYAMLEPTARLQELERAGDLFGRLALMDETRTLPFGAVWDQFCERHDLPRDGQWQAEVRNYERDVLASRA